MADGELIVDINANVSGLESGLNRAKEGLSQVEAGAAKAGESATRASGGFADFAKNAMSFAAGGLIANGISELTTKILDFGKESLTAATTAQTSIVRLSTALQDNIGGWRGNMTAVNEYLESASKLDYSQNALRDSLSSLVARTHDLTQAENLQAIAADLARGKNIDLSTATNIVGKVFSGNVGILARYGIAVEKGSTATEALAAIQKTFAGQSTAYAGTVQGAMDNLGNTFEEIKVKVGTAATTLLTQLSPAIVSVASGASKLVTDLVNGLGPALTGIWNILQSLWPVLQKIISGALDTMKGLVDGIAQAWRDLQKPLADTGNSLSILQPIFQWISDNGEKIGNVIGVVAAAWVAYTAAQIGANIAIGIWDALTSPWLAILAAIAIAIGLLVVAWNGLQQAVQNATQGITTLLNALKLAWDTNFMGIQTDIAAIAPFLQGLLQTAQQVFGFLGNLVQTFTQDFTDYIMFLVQNIPALMTAMGDMMSGNYQQGADELIGLAENFSQQMQQKHREAGAQSSQNFADGLAANQAAVNKAADNLRMGATNALNGDTSGAYAAGSAITAAWGNGIVASGNAAVNAAVTIYNKVAGIFGAANKLGVTGSPTYSLPPTYGLTSGQTPEEIVSTELGLYGTQGISNLMPIQPTKGIGGGGGGGGGGKGGGGGSKGTTVDAIKAAADEAKAFADAVNSAISGVANVMNISIPQGFADKVAQLASIMDTAVAGLEKVALNFGAKGLTAVSAFADASGKVFDAFGKAFDFFTKIADTGDKILNGSAKLVTLTNELAQKVVIIMNTLGPMVALWSTDAAAKVGAFADASGKVFDAFGKALDFFQKIGDVGDKVLNGSAKLVTLTNQLSEKIVIVMNTLGPMVALWDSKADKIVSEFADASGKVFDSLSKAVDFFEKLAGADKISFANLASRAQEIANATQAMMNTLGPLVGTWSDMKDKTNTFAQYVAGFATAAGAVADGLAKAVGFFDVLAASKVGFSGLAGRVTELANATQQMINTFGPLSFGWQTFNTMVTDFANTVGTVADNLGKVVSLFGGLAAETFKVPSGAVFSAFFDGLGTMLNEFKQRSTSWSQEADKDTATLAGYVGAILDGIGKAVAPLVALNSYKSVPTGVIDTFFNDLGTFLNAFATRAASFKAQATDEVAKIAANIGTIAESLGKVVDPLLKVLGFKAPDSATPNPSLTIVGGSLQLKDAGATGMDAFFNALTTFIQEFASRSSQWVAANDKTVQSIATGIGTVMDGIGKAITPLTDLEKFKAPGQSTIDAFFNVMSAFLNKVQALVAAVPATFVANAVAFAAGINQMFGDLSSAMTTAAGIKTPADLPGIFKNILSAIQDVVTYMSNTAVSAWASANQKFVSDAQQAAAAINAAYNGIVYPGGSTTGGGTTGTTGTGTTGGKNTGVTGPGGVRSSAIGSFGGSNFNSGGSVTLNLYLDGMQMSPQQLSQRLGLRARITEVRT